MKELDVQERGINMTDKERLERFLNDEEFRLSLWDEITRTSRTEFIYEPLLEMRYAHITYVLGEVIPGLPYYFSNRFDSSRSEKEVFYEKVNEELPKLREYLKKQEDEK